jgi:hypothetical protein
MSLFPQQVTRPSLIVHEWPPPAAIREGSRGKLSAGVDGAAGMGAATGGSTRGVESAGRETGAELLPRATLIGRFGASRAESATVSTFAGVPLGVRVALAAAAMESFLAFAAKTLSIAVNVALSIFAVWPSVHHLPMCVNDGPALAANMARLLVAVSGFFLGMGE